MQQFILWLQTSHALHPVERAAEAHYRLVTIHPFVDGNGRTARLLMNLLLLRRISANSGSVNRSGLESLSDRELEIYQMIGAGLNTRDIAPRLGISPKTVATHRENIKAKLGIKDGRALLQQAMNQV